MNARTCNSRHNVCKVQAENILSLDREALTPEIINNFLHLITSNANYNNCLNKYTNSAEYVKVYNAIIKISSITTINPIIYIYICYYIDEESLYIILQNQILLHTAGTSNGSGTSIQGYCNILLEEKNGKNQYNNLTNILLAMTNKKKLFTEFLNNTSFPIFMKNILLFKNCTCEYDQIIINYIKNFNVEIIKPNTIQIIDTFINKCNLIYELYPYLEDLNINTKKNIIDKTISNLDKRFLIKMLDYESLPSKNNKIIIDDTTIKNMLNKVYMREIYGASNNKIISEIMDIFIDYGFTITKEIIILLLTKGCYINNIERTGFIIDIEILEKCSELNYYPYEFTCIPTKKIMLLECSRNNLNTLTMLKEKGGIIDIDCLNSAVSLKRNGKIIKYIINNCNVKPNTETLRIFQEVNSIECLDLLVSNYKSGSGVGGGGIGGGGVGGGVNTNCLDPSSLLSIEPITNDLQIGVGVGVGVGDGDGCDGGDGGGVGVGGGVGDGVGVGGVGSGGVGGGGVGGGEYVIHNKIKKMLGYKKNKILPSELEKLLLKYIIDNKLVISNYFILNEEFANIIKMDKGVIMNIDQLKIMIPYFIEIK